MTSSTLLSTIAEVLDFLDTHFSPEFTSYGTSHELRHGPDGRVVEGPALKPSVFFRGQNRVHPRLTPTLHRAFPALNQYSLTRETILHRKDGAHRVIATNPHYDPKFDQAFVFSRLKCLEIGALLRAQFADFPREIDAGALCQHYELPTPFIDFTENLAVAAFFATHTRASGSWTPCGSGSGRGVLYMLDAQAARADNQRFYEIGIQPLPRPFAQKGSLFFVPHDLNMLSQPYVRCFGFTHDEATARDIAARLGAPERLFPPDKFADLVESHHADTYVTREAIDLFLDEPQRPRRDERHRHLMSLLGSVEIR